MQNNRMQNNSWQDDAIIMCRASDSVDVPARSILIIQYSNRTPTSVYIYIPTLKCVPSRKYVRLGELADWIDSPPQECNIPTLQIRNTLIQGTQFWGLYEGHGCGRYKDFDLFEYHSRGMRVPKKNTQKAISLTLIRDGMTSQPVVGCATSCFGADFNMWISRRSTASLHEHGIS